MALSDTLVQVREPTDVAAARRAAARQASWAGFDDEAAGRVALVATEAAGNLLKHTADGGLVLSGMSCSGDQVEVIALDRGPGMSDPAAALADAYSTAGGPGTGLGAIRRAADVFDLWSAPGQGTAVYAAVGPGGASGDVSPGPLTGGVNVPFPGESVSGDAWLSIPATPGATLVAVADGLGHGPEAHQAARVALRVCRERAAAPPAEILRAAHAALSGTRGAALAVARVDHGAGELRFAGVGNIAAFIAAPEGIRRLVSFNGTAGLVMQQAREFVEPWPGGALLVLHTDGVTSRAGLDPYPALRTRHPALPAALLYRDFVRGHDDATVVVHADRPR